jgi:hypothetical protein
MQALDMGMMKETYKIQSQNLRKPGGRSEHRWDDNIKTDSKQILCNGTDWI